MEQPVLSPPIVAAIGKNFPKIIKEKADAAEGIATAYSMTVNQRFSGTITEGDADWIKVNFNPNDDTSYRLHASGLGADTFYPSVLLVSGTETRLVGGHQDGNNSTDYLDFKPSEFADFDVYIRVRSVAGDQNSEYYLDFTTYVREVEDAPASIETPYVVNPRDTFEGRIETGAERDWIGYRLEKGHSYDFSISDSTFSPKKPVIYIYDTEGNFEQSTRVSNEEGTTASLFTVEKSGVYYVSVNFSSSLKTGTYFLRSNDMGKLPVLSDQQIANYLKNGYWNDRLEDGKTIVPLKMNGNDQITVNLKELTADGKQAAKWALETWSEYTGLSFKIIGKKAQINFDDEETDDAFAHHNYNNKGISTSVDINIGLNRLNGGGVELGERGPQIYLHEIGHALGLGHAGNYNRTAEFGEDNHFLNDSTQSTIMSYFNLERNTFVNGSAQNNATPMMADLLAIADLYGLTHKMNMGNTVWGNNSNIDGPLAKIFKAWLDGVEVAGVSSDAVTFLLQDNGGRDTLNLSKLTEGTNTVDMSSGGVSDIGGAKGNMVIGKDTIIENYKGGAARDNVTGNDVKNRLDGGGGYDNLSGKKGNDVLLGRGEGDWLFGGAGKDKLFGHSGVDFLVGGAGNDRITGGADGDFFNFEKKEGKDIVLDFEDDLDTLYLSQKLWKGTLTEKQVLNKFAEVRNGNVVLDFGKDELTLKGFSNINALQDDILIF